MISFLYLVFISPLEFLLQIILENAYGLAASYGLSLILLSLVVQIITSPLYRLAEKWQQKERNLSLKLAPKMKEINKAFKGQERFMMMRTLYRQNQYHPLMATRTSFGFLIQVPFFMSAFYFLSAYEPFEGQAFLFFINLGEADGLLHLFGAQFNLMPFVMSGVNLLAVIVYTKQDANAEKTQLFIVTGLFFVLLYNSSVALLLYWTANNTFSLLRKNQFIGELKINLQNNFLKPLARNFLPRFQSINLTAVKLEQSFVPKLKAALFLIILLFLGKYLANEVNVNVPPLENSLLVKDIQFVVAYYFALISSIKYLKNFQNTFMDRLSVILVIFLMCISISLLYDYVFVEFARHEDLNVLGKEIFVLGAIILTNMANIWAPLCLKVGREYYWKLNIASSVFIFSTLLLFSIKILSSDSDLFEYAFNEIFAHLMKLLIWTILVSSLIFKITPQSHRSLISFTMCTFVVLTFAYSHLFTIDSGAIDFSFINMDMLNRLRVFFYDIAIIGAALGLMYWVFKRKAFKVLCQLIVLSILPTALYTAYIFQDNPVSEIEKVSKDDNIPSYNDQLLSFSKDGKNVVIFMLDMFDGGEMQSIIDENPELQNELDGFTWYRNSLSSSSKTHGGEPGILGGHSYTPIEANKRTVSSKREDVAKGFANFTSSFIEKNYKVSSVDIYTTDCSTLSSAMTRGKIIQCLNLRDDYNIFWKSLKSSELEMNIQFDEFVGVEKIATFLSTAALFNVVPFKSRSIIFDQGNWLGSIPMDKMSLKFSLNHYSFLDSMHLLSNANSPTNTFKYIRNKVTHFPYAMSKEDCLPSRKVGDPYDSSYCAIQSIVKWIKWMKEAEVYDNTQIVLVSDHGKQTGKYVPLELIYQVQRKTKGLAANRPHALMLVKDIASRHPLKVSDIFLSNADTPSIVCEVINGCENIIRSPIKFPIKDREIDYSVLTSQETGKYNVIIHYKVKNNLFDYQNWRQVYE